MEAVTHEDFAIFSIDKQAQISWGQTDGETEIRVTQDKERSFIRLTMNFRITPTRT
jgi:hypothetical protein